MAKLFGILGIVLCVYVLYYAVQFYRLTKISADIVAHTVPFSKNDPGYGESILVLGDSSAVGVGASKPEESVAGRLSEFTSASYVENKAVSGATVRDLAVQIAQVSQTHYSIILIQIGGNDIVRLHGPKHVADLLAAELADLPRADKVIVISAGDVGSAPLFPWPITLIYHALNLSYHEQFARALSGPIEGYNQGNITYVNLYTAPNNDLFSLEPQRYFAADGFHPSSAGYSIWFDAVKSVL